MKTENKKRHIIRAVIVGAIYASAVPLIFWLGGCDFNRGICTAICAVITIPTWFVFFWIAYLMKKQ